MNRAQLALTVRQEVVAVWNNALGFCAGEPAATADRIDTAVEYILQCADQFRADNKTLCQESSSDG